MRMKQQTLAMAAVQTFENYRKPTRRDEFLNTMQAIVPWVALCEAIEPHYPKAKAGESGSMNLAYVHLSYDVLFITENSASIYFY